jgi:hypothetical protein
MPKGRVRRADGAAPAGNASRLETFIAEGVAGLPKPKRVPKKRVMRLERQLAGATKTEVQRVRKLERAHRRRQRLETAVDAARMAKSSRLLWKAAAKKAASASKAKGLAKTAKTARAKVQVKPPAKAAAPTAAPPAAKTPTPTPTRTATSKTTARTAATRTPARPAAPRTTTRTAAAKRNPPSPEVQA